MISDSQIEKTLRLFEKAVETTQLGVTITDTEGKIIYMNTADAKIHGYATKELLEQNVRVLAPQKFWQHMTLEDMKKIKSWQRESINIRKDGSTFPVQLTSDVVIGENDTPIGIVTICEDITSRKQAEEEVLRGKEKFLKDILDSIQDGISILDKDMNILSVNPTMERWYAHNLPLRGKKCYTAYHNRTERCDICPSIKTLNSGEPAIEIVPFTGAKGVIGWQELYTFPLIDSRTDQLVGVIEYVRDITDRKKMEDAVHERIKELEQFYEMAVGRELRMKELKEKIAKLEAELSKYKKD